EVAREVAGGNVVSGNDERGARAERLRIVEQGRDEIGPDRSRRPGLDGRRSRGKIGRERAVALVVAGKLEQRSQGHGTQNDRTRSGHCIAGRWRSAIFESSAARA